MIIPIAVVSNSAVDFAEIILDRDDPRIDKMYNNTCPQQLITQVASLEVISISEDNSSLINNGPTEVDDNTRIRECIGHSEYCILIYGIMVVAVILLLLLQRAH